MKLYHDELTRLLLKFGNDCRETYTLEDLWQDYRNGIGHGFMWGVCNAVGVLSTKSLGPNSIALKIAQTFIKKVFPR